MAEAAISAATETWPTRSAELDSILNERIAEVFAQTSPEDALALLLRAPRHSQDQLKLVLRLPRSTRKLNRGMASALLSMLQHQGSPYIAVHLVSGFVQSLEETRLDRPQWIRLLTGAATDVAELAAERSDLRQAMDKLARFPMHSRIHALLVAALSSTY